MTALHIVSPQPPAYALVPVLCQACAAALGTVYADDHTTLLCGRCALVWMGVEPNDQD